MTSSLCRERSWPPALERVGPLLDRWVSRLSSEPPALVLADGEDPRCIAAAVELAARGVMRPTLLGDETVVRARLAAVAGRGVPGTVRVVDTSRAVVPPDWVARLRERDVAASDREAVEAARDPLLHAALAVWSGQAAAAVAGATRPTAEVIRAGLKVIGLAPGASRVTSSFLMALPGGRVMAYGDCAVIPEPDAAELAEVAVATARSYELLTGEDPAVAMLSFSTKGSASHDRVDTVVAATERVRRTRPGLRVDGELQFDAAYLPSVARAKAPDSPVAGCANVFVFPNLDAGNICYKVSERLGGALAFGPILQGFQAPLNDLSRGCSETDVLAVALVSGMQSLLSAGGGSTPEASQR